MAAQAAEKLLAELQRFNETVSDTDSIPHLLRSKLKAAMKRTDSVVTSPADKVAQLMLEHPAEAIVARAAADLSVFSTLHNAGSPKSAQDIAYRTGADPALLVRLFRALSAYGAVTEVGADEFEVAPAYGLFRERSFENCYGPCVDFMNKIFLPTPGHLKKTGYKNLTDPMSTVIQDSFDMAGAHFYEIFGAQKGLHTHFSQMMLLWADGWTQFQTLYPVQEKLVDGYDSSKSNCSFVDVGGNWGQQALSLKEAFPQLPGRFIVQDLYSIDAAPKDDPKYADIEWMKHDFFAKQPIHGAQIYYLRTVLHNWSDQQCIEILKNLRAVMIPGYSKVIIHECIMPERGAGQWIATQDIEMMAMFGSAERTKEQFGRLCKEAGLRLVQTYQDDNPSHEGLVEAEVDE